MNRRIFAWLSVLLAFTMLLTACGPKSTPTPAGPVKLVFLAQGSDDAQGKVFEELTNKFNETKGKELNIVVEFQKVPSDWPEYTQKVVAQIAAGNAPDVVNLSPLLKVDFTGNNYLMDLKPLMDADQTDLTQWYAPTFDSWKDDKGHYYGVGHGIYTEAIYYNKELFAAAGIDVPSLTWDQSWTWDELAAIAQKLTVGEGADKQYGFYVEPQLGWMTPIFRSFCGSIGKPDGSALNMGSEGSVAGLEYVMDLMWNKGVAPRPDVSSATPAGDLFLTGKLAMFLDGSWWMPYYSESIEFEWGVLPLPKGKCGTFTGYWVDSYAITAASKHGPEAYQFIKFMVGEEASNMYVDNGLFGVPSNIAVANSRANDLFKPLTPEEAKVWLDSANYGSTPEYTNNWNEVWDMTNKVLQRIELGEPTAQEAGELMDAEAAKLIEAAK